MENQASASPVQSTITVESSSLLAPSALPTWYLTQNPLSAHLALKDTPGKTTPVLNVQIIMSEMELLAMFARREPLHLKIRPSAKSPPLMSSLSQVSHSVYSSLQL